MGEIGNTQMMIGLAIGIALLIILVLKTKIHTFIALIISALVTGLIGGMNPSETMKAISNGFGNTLSSTGIIIGLGVMMGALLEQSGAAEKMAYTFIKVVGKKKEEWALAITGWVVSIPVFADSALVILAPLAKAISRISGKSVVGLALALACGLQVTHSLVPPTPGPLTAAGLMNVDVGVMIIVGIVITIPMLIVGVLYSKWVSKRIYQVPTADGTGYIRKDFKEEYITAMEDLDSVISGKKLPSAAMSFAPIVVPLLLIFAKTIADFTGMSQEGMLYYVISLLGSPIIAIGVGTLIALYGLCGKEDKKLVISKMEDGVKTTGMIMLITGAGGALGNVIRESGIGDALGEVVLGLAIPAILVPCIIAMLMRIALGSATVAITTAASLTAPLMATLGVNPVLLAQSCCVGAIAFSYFNDSGYWVFNGMFGLTEMKDQVRCKTAVSMIMTAMGIVMLFILNMFI